MKILLMNVPYSVEERYGKVLKSVGPSMLPPLGLCYIASMIRKDHDVKILDVDILNLSPADIASYLSKNTFDMIGITLMTPMYGNFVKTLKAIKPMAKDAKIVVGGPHPSMLPKETLEENPEVDFAVFGEGEATFPALIKALEEKKDISEVNGVAYRKEGKIKLSNFPSLITDLDSLPYPSLDLIPVKKYVPAPSTYRRLPMLHMITSRGCPFRCIYCSSQSIFGRKYRLHSIERVINEIKNLVGKYRAKEIYFLDDLFTLNKKWVNDICDKIISEGIHKKLCWSCNTRADIVDIDLLRKMKKAGCWQIHFGIETGSQRLLDIIKKGITIEHSRNAVRLCRKAGIQTRAYFMLGLPTETRKESLRTIEFAKEIDPDYAKFSITTPYPGTELFDIVKKEGNLKSTSWEIYKTMGGFGGSERPYVPKGRTSKEINELQKRAHKEFYFRPKVILRFISNISSFSEVKVYLRSAIALFRA